MKTLVIEDNKFQLEEITALINEYFPEIEVVGVATNISEASDLLLKEKPDLVISDIVLKNSTVFDLLDQIQHIDFDIVFVTGHDSFALRALKLNAIDYIMKPIDSIALKNAIEKVKQKKDMLSFKERYDQLSNSIKTKEIKKISIPSINGYIFIEIDNIVRCESEGNYTEIFVENGDTIISSKPLKEYQELLESNYFFRSHHSHLVNLKMIKIFSKGVPEIMMENGDKIPVARRRKDELIEILKSNSKWN